MTDFADRVFVAGSLTGIRSFKIDRYGRLTGVNVETVWTPGENVGECLRNATTAAYIASFSFLLSGYGTAVAKEKPKDPDEPKKVDPAKPHDVGAYGCECGYYGYFDNDSNPYHKTGQILGLIEGYGVATVGLRGFRCAKARLQALIIKPKSKAVLLDRVRHNYADVPIFPSRELALAQFPLTPPAVPTPESDPEFWTRPVKS